MKKIGILTFHKSINYGAFMQCFALTQKLKCDFPEAHIEVINYATERVFRNYSTRLGDFIFGTKEQNSGKNILQLSRQSTSKILQLCKNPLYLRFLKIRQKHFEMAWNSLPLSEYSIVTDDYNEFFADIKGKYDVIIVGSDGVWEWYSYGFPNAYFLNEDLGAKKISFAATSDRIYFENVKSIQKEYLKNAWRDFKYLGVRDEATENLIKNTDANFKPIHNCDPTILLDIEKIPANLNTLEQKIKKGKIDLSKPIIGLMANDKIGRLARDIFGDKYQIIAVYNYNKYADYNMPNLTPFEWAKIFSFFRLTLTNYFHGTLLSLKNCTPVITFDLWKSCGGNLRTKLEDLFNRLDLTEYYFNVHSANCFDKKIVEDRISKILENPEIIKMKIKSSLEKEANNYDSFKDALKNLLN